jgi:transcriptional regulator with XRE-family HTH domain
MIAQIESGKLNNLTLRTLARTAAALDADLKIDLVPRQRSGAAASSTDKTRKRAIRHGLQRAFVT